MDEAGVDLLIEWTLNVEHNNEHRIDGDHYITNIPRTGAEMIRVLLRHC